MLPRNQRQEALSRAYVRAVAARAGVLCTDTTQDFGIDLFFRAVGNRRLPLSPLVQRRTLGACPPGSAPAERVSCGLPLSSRSLTA